MSSPIALALIEQMVRAGLLSATDVDEMAKRLQADGHEADALSCRMSFVQAHAPSQTEWEADQRRQRLRIVPTGDGGNDT